MAWEANSWPLAVRRTSTLRTPRIGEGPEPLGPAPPAPASSHTSGCPTALASELPLGGSSPHSLSGWGGPVLGWLSLFWAPWGRGALRGPGLHLGKSSPQSADWALFLALTESLRDFLRWPCPKGQTSWAGAVRQARAPACGGHFFRSQGQGQALATSQLRAPLARLREGEETWPGWAPQPPGLRSL